MDGYPQVVHAKKKCANSSTNHTPTYTAYPQRSPHFLWISQKPIKSIHPLSHASPRVIHRLSTVYVSIKYVRFTAKRRCTHTKRTILNGALCEECTRNGYSGLFFLLSSSLSRELIKSRNSDKVSSPMAGSAAGAGVSSRAGLPGERNNGTSC